MVVSALQAQDHVPCNGRRRLLLSVSGERDTSEYRYIPVFFLPKHCTLCGADMIARVGETQYL